MTQAKHVGEGPFPRFNPWTSGPRLKAVVGHYGSGKTELALNLALLSAQSGNQTALVDLDIVNPFFRSAERADLLRARGVEVIYPPYALTGVDVPVLPAEVQSIFARPSLNAILDVGGDEAGAAALGRYRPQFALEPCEVFYVVNVFRPFSGDAAQIEALLERIALRGRLAPAALINNANLGDQTRPEHLLEGQRILEEASAKVGLPIAAVSGLPAVLSELPPLGVPLLPIERLLKPAWMAD